MDPHTRAILEDIVRRESRSLLQYVRDSFPWTSADEDGALAKLKQLIDAEGQALAALFRFIVRSGATAPYLGSFPASFTTSNFVSLDFLLPRLAQDQRQKITALEHDLASMRDPAARGQVQKLLDVKRQHLRILDDLAAAHRSPVPVS
jgi:hypothetical protein